MNKFKYEIIFHGRVQGVGFRYFVKKIADQMKIRGFVKNLLNGNVLSVFVCTENDYNQFVRRIIHGNGFSSVSEIEEISKEYISNSNIMEKSEFYIKF